jgi:putative DNA primase/helicase
MNLEPASPVSDDINAKPQPSKASPPESDMTIDRLALLAWLLPHCEAVTASLMYSKGASDGPGWVNGEEDVERAISAFRAGTLASEQFASITKDGRRYTITEASRLGLVPHRDGMVGRFCIDLDDHGDDGGNVHLAPAIDRFFGAESIKFTSKSGKGLHCFFALAEPVPVEWFIAWASAWGFNRRGDIECFPKSAKRSQVWLPCEPNDDGGDAWTGGTFEACVVQALPAEPSKRLNRTTLDFARGFVASGWRNDGLNRAAYHCAKQRLSETEARTLCLRGAELCGLLAEESEQAAVTFLSGYRAGAEEVRQRKPKVTDDRMTAPDLLRGLGCTDYGNAQRLVRRHGANLRHCYDFGQWLGWTGTHWSFDPAVAEQLAKDTVLAIYSEVGELADAKERELLHRHAVVSEAASRIGSMLALARSEPNIPIRPNDLDRDVWMLNCANGTIDLRSGILHPHRRENLITRCLSTAFEPGVECPGWRAFLNRIMDGNADIISFVQRAVGYTLTGSTAERCMFILHGGGKNGKTVFLEGLRLLLGDGYTARTPTQTLLAKRGETIPNDLARLRGVRLVTASETGDGNRLDEALVKDITGGDRVVARFMRGEWFEFTPHFKIFLSTNYRPRISGTDDAIWDRLRLVPFLIRIPEEERQPMEQMLAEFRAELPGILNWAIRGCLDWQRNGLGEPPEVRMATADFRDEMDTLGDFLSDCCVLRREARVASQLLYDEYKRWATEAGERVLSHKRFSQWMEHRGQQSGFHKQHTREGKVWQGLSLAYAFARDQGSAGQVCDGSNL